MKKILMMLFCMVVAQAALAQDDNKTDRKIVTTETATQFSNDQKLVEIYNKMNAKPAKEKKVKDPREKKVKMPMTALDYQRKAKRLRTTAFVCGGVLIAGGLVCTLIGDREYTDKYKEYYDSDYNVSGFDYDIFHSRYFGTMTAIGVSAIGAGAVIGTSCMLAAHKNDKLSRYAVSASPVWNSEINFKNGSRLDLGLDALGDRTSYNKTVGLGVRYSF